MVLSSCVRFGSGVAAAVVRRRDPVVAELAAEALAAGSGAVDVPTLARVSSARADPVRSAGDECAGKGVGAQGAKLAYRIIALGRGDQPRTVDDPRSRAHVGEDVVDRVLLLGGGLTGEDRV